MQFPTNLRILSGLLALLLFLPVTGAQAGSRVKVKGDVETVAEQVDQAFEQLEIAHSEKEISSAHAKAVGKARSGARVTVSVSDAGEDECEVSVSSESPTDEELEERFLRLMRTR